MTKWPFTNVFKWDEDTTLDQKGSHFFSASPSLPGGHSKPSVRHVTGGRVSRRGSPPPLRRIRASRAKSGRPDQYDRNRRALDAGAAGLSESCPRPTSVHGTCTNLNHHTPHHRARPSDIRFHRGVLWWWVPKRWAFAAPPVVEAASPAVSSALLFASSYDCVVVGRHPLFAELIFQDELFM